MASRSTSLPLLLAMKVLQISLKSNLYTSPDGQVEPLAFCGVLLEASEVYADTSGDVLPKQG